MAPSDWLHCFRFTVYEVGYEEGIPWQKIQVAFYILLQGRGDFAAGKKMHNFFKVQNTFCRAAAQSQASVHAHKHTQSQPVGCFLHCKSFSAPDKDLVESKSS